MVPGLLQQLLTSYTTFDFNPIFQLDSGGWILKLLILKEAVAASVCRTGSLIDYSFSKGHLMHVAGTMAVQNTLVLHDDTDSMSFFFEAGDGTKRVNLKLEHPQLDIKGSPAPLFSYDRREGTEAGGFGGPSVLAGEFQLYLPPGPLYSRIVLEAEDSFCFFLSCVLNPTTYVLHVIRVGEAISLWLAGDVSSHGMGQPVVFQEERRWRYQEQHAEWYVPSLWKNASLAIELQPVCFAPLHRATKDVASHASLVQYARSCHCYRVHERAAGVARPAWHHVHVPFLAKDQ